MRVAEDPKACADTRGRLGVARQCADDGNAPGGAASPDEAHPPTGEELSDLFRPEEHLPRWIWQDALRLRPHRQEVGAGIAYRALIRTAARLQGAIREGGRP